MHGSRLFGVSLVLGFAAASAGADDPPAEGSEEVAREETQQDHQRQAKHARQQVVEPVVAFDKSVRRRVLSVERAEEFPRIFNELITGGRKEVSTVDRGHSYLLT